MNAIVSRARSEPWPHPFDALCRCGQRLGKHRHGDDACPNRLWRCGNGQPQWLNMHFVRPALSVVEMM